jgi:hypothetical protein
LTFQDEKYDSFKKILKLIIILNFKTMAKIHSYLKFLFIIGIMFVFVSYVGCNNDDDEDSKESLLIGVWTITNADVEASVGGVPILDYLTDVLEYSQLEAEEFLNFIEAMLLPNFTGTIEFKENHTYVTTFGGDVDDGTWNLNSSGDLITLDDGTIDEMTINVTTLTATTLVGSSSIIESVDINGDMVPDVDITLTIGLTLSK